MVWFFIGGLPPFLSPHPCPSPTPSLSETLKVLERGIRRLCLPVGFVFAPKVPTIGSLGREPEVGWSPTVYSLWRRPLAVGAKAAVSALPTEAPASRRHADAAFQPLAGEFE